jgi:hypothetical protein
LYSDFTNRPDQKSNGLKSGRFGASGNTKKSLACGRAGVAFYAKI